MLRHPQSGDLTQVEAAHTPAPSVSSAQLTVLIGVQLGHVFSLSLPVVTLGRTDEADIRLRHSSVSRAHARIHKTDAGYELEDLGSSNGTLVNGRPLRGRCTLRSGDRIRVGPRVLLQFAIVDRFDERLRELEKLEAASQLSTAVNHDLNNLLSVLTCGLSYLVTRDPNETLGAPDILECLQDMQLAAQKAGELTHRLNTLVRQPDKSVSERVDLSALCDEVARMLKRIVPETIRVESRIEPSLCVEGNRAWLHQLLMNPCVNSRDAMDDVGTLRIEARAARPADVADHTELEAVPYVLVTIADTGRGIPAQLMERVFQPFFTTKGAGKGTGLGLATVARVAKEHGGAVYLTSEVGVGTTLRIFLPKSLQMPSESLIPSVVDGEPTSVHNAVSGAHPRRSEYSRPVAPS